MNSMRILVLSTSTALTSYPCFSKALTNSKARSVTLTLGKGNDEGEGSDGYRHQHRIKIVLVGLALCCDTLSTLFGILLVSCGTVVAVFAFHA